ncbi:hypothetical protein AMELA_G00267010, partial [Ameiurus melas]
PAFQRCRGCVLTFNSGGGVAPPICWPTETASLPVTARDISDRGPGPPLEWGSFGGGFCHKMASRGHYGTVARLPTSHVTVLFSRFRMSVSFMGYKCFVI